MRPLSLSLPNIPVGDHHAWRVHLARRLAEAETAVVDRDVRIAELEDHRRNTAKAVDELHLSELRAWARVAELEAELTALVHPFDLAAYRAKKSLDK